MGILTPDSRLGKYLLLIPLLITVLHVAFISNIFNKNRDITPRPLYVPKQVPRNKMRLKFIGDQHEKIREESEHRLSERLNDITPRPLYVPKQVPDNKTRLKIIGDQHEKIREDSEHRLSGMLKREFYGLDFKNNSFNPGQPLPVTKIQRVVLVSSWRSGSSFVGDLLSSFPGTFYTYEPLHYLQQNQMIDDESLVTKSMSLLRDILKCSYTRQREYVAEFKNFMESVQHNKRFWRACARNPILCHDPWFLERICPYFPVHIIKVLRLGLLHLSQVLDSDDLGDVKILYLTRDPRGVMSSRRGLWWCQHPSCSDAKTVCTNMHTDLTLAQQLANKYPTRFKMVRYEDIALHPEEESKNIFDFIRLPFIRQVQTFITSHTNAGADASKDPHSTYRKSDTTVFNWRKKLSFQEALDIQSSCHSVLDKLGFQEFHNDQSYQNMSISVMKNML